ncbi:hypothetical protein ACN4EG_26245 [Alkalinema pantanalense CENA528]|uniref:hypothetical protein n=1 Tax=Alkalinema pantanalense TaxID=1620705 RepID=UPI003D6EF9A8
MDWFIASIVPEELNHFDFLSRCERIWTDSEPAEAAMLFTRIFNYRVKFVTGYEDGMRLVLCRVEVSHPENPPAATLAPKVTVQPFDLMRRMDAYQGSPDGDDWHSPVKVPMGLARWNFTLAEIDRQTFEQLRDRLGEANFQTIVGTQGYEHLQNDGSTYRGEDNLPLHYYIRETDQAGISDLILVSFGEFQPSRWMAHVEGIWQIVAAADSVPDPQPLEMTPVAEPEVSEPQIPQPQTSQPPATEPQTAELQNHWQADLPEQQSQTPRSRRLTAQQKTVLQFLAIGIGVIVAIRIVFWLGGLLILGAILWALYQAFFQQER